MKHVITTAATALVGAALVAGSVSAASAAPGAPGAPGAWGDGHSTITSGGVVRSTVPFAQGNRHQVRLTTTDTSTEGYVRSYYCPTGATVTSTWASSRCTHRGTAKVVSSVRVRTNGTTTSDIHTVSSTGLSGWQDGLIGLRTAGGRHADMAVELTFSAQTRGPGTSSASVRGFVSPIPGPYGFYVADTGIITTTR